jgi:hypothetical protein
MVNFQIYYKSLKLCVVILNDLKYSGDNPTEFRHLICNLGERPESSLNQTAD